MRNSLTKASARSLYAALGSVIVAFWPATSCGQQRSANQMSAAESAQAVEAMTTWFECEECQGGELEAVRRYGQAVVPSLIAVLDQGLSPAMREQMRREFAARYDALGAQAQRNPSAKVASTKEEFTALYLGNLEAQYRVRAAQGLASIGGAQARVALERALNKQQRSDVQTAIRQSLSQLR